MSNKVRCKGCRKYIDRVGALRRGLSYVCNEACITAPHSIDFYNDVVEDDNYSCRGCGAGFGSIQVHHVVYRSAGGSDAYENLISLCQACHSEVHKAPKSEFQPYFEEIIRLRIGGDKATTVVDIKKKEPWHDSEEASN